MAKVKDNKIVYTEKEISGQIKSYLRTCHSEIFFWSNEAFRFQKTKVPDLEGILLDGRHFYIEVKRPGNKLTEGQEKFINEVSNRGELTLVAYSLEDVVAWLNNLGKDK